MKRSEVELARIIFWVIGTVLGLVAGLLAILFRRPDVLFLDPSASTFALVRYPGRYVREPYAHIVKVLVVASFAFVLVAIVSAVFWYGLLPVWWLAGGA